MAAAFAIRPAGEADLPAVAALFRGYARALGDYLLMPLPPWIAEHPHKDNWLAVAKVRAQSEAANPSPGKAKPVNDGPQTIATLVDDHHDF